MAISSIESGSKSSLLISCAFLVLLEVAVQPVQGSLMGKGLFWMHRDNKPKPWDVDRRPHNYYEYEPAENSYMQPSDSSREDGEDAPCVGLCYYRKLMNLENRMNEEDNDNMKEEIVFEELTTQKPCVGLCQYYRSMGMENPYEKRQVKRFTAPAGF
eukprot:maker-scaffold797_size95806-snap-gene-0.22 protein:Tk12328 transcript:maker-scaffold797_size95806-snap-gene-0.22-mRNA-1 annotation:"hypothetical protein BAUCODRAFT_31170"